MKFPFTIILFIAIISPHTSSGINLRGIVTDENKQPLPYAAVYIMGTTQGTATNMQGAFSLSLEAGTYQVAFQYIGYKKRVETITIAQTTVTLNIRMEPEEITLREVEINSEDPAYRIIRKAISRSDLYLKQVEKYQCKVFTKSVFRLTNAPDKMFGEKILEQGDTLGGIFYLSESESQVSFQQPDKVRELMISSKVSGNDKGFSFNYYSFFMMSFYNNLVQPPVSNKRGYVSPLSDNAMMYYRYRLDGSFEDAGNTIYKIRVIPRRNMDPVFSGYIYIHDRTYRIHSADLMLGTASGINFVDSLRISQQYFPVNDTTWMIFAQKINFYFSMDFFGKKFSGNGIFHSQNTGYNLEIVYPKGFFSEEYIRVNEDANKKDSTYWSSTRPIPLTAEEESNYNLKDSIEKIENSKEYLDSVSRQGNKPSIGVIWSGYNFENLSKGITHSIPSPIWGVQFNTIQGWNIALDYSFRLKLKDDRNFSFAPEVLYGFSDYTWRGSLSAHWYYNPNHFAWVRLEGGLRAIKQFNGKEAIIPLVNSLYSVFGELNYLKAYENSFVRISHRSEIARGLYLNAAAEFARRTALVNHKNSPVTEISGRHFTSNDPQDPDNYDPAFESHNALIISAGLAYTFGIKYLYIPRKVVRTGRFPTLLLSVSQGVPEVFSSKVRFTFIEAGIIQKFKCGLAGQMQISGMGGLFLDKSPEYFIDYKHFNANRTIFSNMKSGSYQLLDYYSYSTDDYYAGFHLEHNFNGWIFNKIPLIKKTKLREVIGLHYLTCDNISNYWEVNFGIDNIFKTIRVDFVLGFEGGNLQRNGFVIRLPFVNKSGINLEP